MVIGPDLTMTGNTSHPDEECPESQCGRLALDMSRRKIRSQLLLIRYESRGREKI
jgi:hypothetical protein